MSDGSVDTDSESIDPLADTEKSLRAKHGEILRVDTKRQTMIFRRPSRAEFRRYLGHLNGSKEEKAQAFEWIVRATIVYPEPKDFELILDKLPGLYLQASKDYLVFVGMSEEEDEKK